MNGILAGHLPAMLATLDPFRSAVNWLCRPAILLTAVTVGFFAMILGYRRWTRPRIFWPAIGVFSLCYLASLLDVNFRAIVLKPDNLPITLMIFSTIFFLWVGLRRAAINDDHLERGLAIPEEGHDQRVLTWPDLVYIELIAMVIACAVLLAWAIMVKAPLEQPANPAYAPNPAKAPWYFLGLQELLVYFDPWVAGVVYPTLIIFGLCAIPYLDLESQPAGYYTLRGRRFGVTVWLFGFLVLWVMLIVLGTFLRGPNWSFFGPFERWDPYKQEALNNIDLSQVWWTVLLGRARPTAQANPVSWLPYWLVREWAGVLIMALYFFVVPAVLRKTLLRGHYAAMGKWRYRVMVFLLLMMALLPMKMALRWLFNVKYLIYLPEFNANL